jgi:two-component system cell cycle sensor histidine kinase/response regulator CckA
MAQTSENQDKKTILVVDNDATIVRFVSDILDHDYNVLTATNGAEGLQRSREFKSEIHILLSDFEMPGMTGIDLATRISEARPGLKVLLMSGFAGGMLVLNEGWHFLPKPFVSSQLRGLIVGMVAPKENYILKA